MPSNHRLPARGAEQFVDALAQRAVRLEQLDTLAQRIRAAKSCGTHCQNGVSSRAVAA
jgi:hypothetical protein